MKLLLTSAGIKNTSIRDALVNLLGKPIAESKALCIPTASYGHPNTTPERPWRFISGREPRTPMCELGWKSLGLLELTALPSIEKERWVQWVHDADVLLANGGDAVYLAHWMRESGLVDLLPSLGETVWVGLSAGSMVMTPRIGEYFVGWKSPTGGDEALGVVDFSIFPHLDHPDLPENTMAAAERWASGIGGPAYAIDDDTAITVVDRALEVVSEGNWRLFAGPSGGSDDRAVTEARGSGTGHDHHRDPDDIPRTQGLAEGDEADQRGDGRVERHQDAEHRLREPSQRLELQRVRHHR